MGLLPVQSPHSWTVVTCLSHFHGLQSFYSFYNHQIMKIRNIKMQMYQRRDLIQLQASELLISWSLDTSNVWREWGPVAIQQKGPKSLGSPWAHEVPSELREEPGAAGERKGLCRWLHGADLVYCCLASGCVGNGSLWPFSWCPIFPLNNCCQSRILTRPPGAIMEKAAAFQ